MNWPGAFQKTGAIQVLRPHKGDIKAITLYTHMIVLGRGTLSDEREDPFYTASGNTPEEAETAAYTVYLRAICCQHHWDAKAPMLLECSRCGIQICGSLPDVGAGASAGSTTQAPAAKPKQRLLGSLLAVLKNRSMARQS